MRMDRRLRRVGTLLFAGVALLMPGCGVLAALLIGAITNAIEGDNGDGGAPTVLLVRNDPASTEAIVKILVARLDEAHVPYAYDVNDAPGVATSLNDGFDAGDHWVRVVYASGWRSRALPIVVVKDGSVTLTFAHAPPDLAAMAGTWFGGADTSLGVPHTYALTIAVSGQVGGRTIDGVVDTATGTLDETSEGVYRVTWSDASVTALVADEAHGHAGFVSDDGRVGALQKGAAAPLPTGVHADVVGAWRGTEVRFAGATFEPSDVDAARAIVSAQQHWTGNDGDGDGSTSVSPLLVTSPATLRFEADAESDAAVPVALSLGMWLTADRTFGFVLLAPTAGGTFPDAGVFQLLKKTP